MCHTWVAGRCVQVSDTLNSLKLPNEQSGGTLLSA
jgi:hypothetical protein